MMLSSNYKYEFVSYGKQGSKFTFSKQSNYFGITILTVVCAVMSLFVLTANHQGKQLGMYYYCCLVATVVMVVTTVFLVCSQTCSESLLVLSSIGVALETSNILGTKTKYFDIHHIKDVVILEAITMSIVFQLVLLPNQQVSQGTRSICPLFQHFRPKLKDLKKVYQEIQEKLVIPFQTQEIR